MVLRVVSAAFGLQKETWVTDTESPAAFGMFLESLSAGNRPAFVQFSSADI